MILISLSIEILRLGKMAFSILRDSLLGIFPIYSAKLLKYIGNELKNV